jgi:hypothetical protein
MGHSGVVFMIDQDDDYILRQVTDDGLYEIWLWYDDPLYSYSVNYHDNNDKDLPLWVTWA